jgi:hypothetical protein
VVKVSSDEANASSGKKRRSLQRPPTRTMIQQVLPLRSPGFPVESGGAQEEHAAPSEESRTRVGASSCEVGNPGTPGPNEQTSKV